MNHDTNNALVPRFDNTKRKTDKILISLAIKKNLPWSPKKDYYAGFKCFLQPSIAISEAKMDKTVTISCTRKVMY